MTCRLCGRQAIPTLFTARIRRQHDALIGECPECGLVQTEQPHWLSEAYRDPINLSDTGLMVRNLNLARRASMIFLLLFDRRATFLDWAGGYGVFVRLMRDRG